MIMDFSIHSLNCASQHSASFVLKALVFITVMDDMYFTASLVVKGNVSMRRQRESWGWGWGDVC